MSSPFILNFEKGMREIFGGFRNILEKGIIYNEFSM